MPIGPSLPPHLQKKRQASPVERNEQQEADREPNPSKNGSTIGIGPTLPLHLATKREVNAEKKVAGPSRPPVAGPSRPPVAGPSMPSAFPQKQAAASYLPEDDDDDDEEIGPSIHLAGKQTDQADGVKEFLEREERLRKEKEEAAKKPKEEKREEWMLVPPTSGDLVASLDPQKLNKARGFASTSHVPVKAKDQTLWTETPAERQQRIADEVMGKKRKAEGSALGPTMDEDEYEEMKRRKRRDEEIKSQIGAFDSTTRGKSLLESHSAGLESEKAAKKDSGKPEGAPVIWDRESMMGVGGKLMDEKDRNRLLKDAKGLGDRFSHGKKGGYL